MLIAEEARGVEVGVGVGELAGDGDKEDEMGALTIAKITVEK